MSESVDVVLARDACDDDSEKSLSSLTNASCSQNASSASAASPTSFCCRCPRVLRSGSTLRAGAGDGEPEEAREEPPREEEPAEEEEEEEPPSPPLASRPSRAPTSAPASSLARRARFDGGPPLMAQGRAMEVRAGTVPLERVKPGGEMRAGPHAGAAGGPAPRVRGATRGIHPNKPTKKNNAPARSASWYKPAP